MIARIYLEKEEYMAFDTGQNFFKFLVPKRLTTITEIKTFEDGYLVVGTNYGEEYIDLRAVTDEINLNIDFENISLTLEMI
ncbi:MAG: hypothetical protein FWC77_05630 [Defluviitaleaceae bacterium]|nr:hypothetical protein [Defluviitaleaceae bacterium]